MSFENSESVVAELVQFTENDGDIYRQTTQPILKNLATKKAQGKYDHDKAVQAFMYLAEAGARKYAQDFDPHGAAWHEMFPMEIRRAAAARWRDEFEEEFKLGNYDSLVPKKYQKSQKPAASAYHASATASPYALLAREPRSLARSSRSTSSGSDPTTRSRSMGPARSS